MNNRERAEILAGRLNQLTLGTHEVEWNTPRSFHIESYMPGGRRIVQLTRNTDDTHGGCSTLFSGSAPEVCEYIRAMLEGIHIGRKLAS